MAKDRIIRAYFEQVLWYLDGPQVVLLRVSDKSYVLAVSIESVHRTYSFFGGRVSPTQLEDYLRNRFDLRFILSNPDRHRHYLFSLPAEGREVQLASLTFSAKRHENFLPEHGTFASDHSEECAVGASPYTYVQRYFIDGKWDTREFSRFHGNLSDLYALSKSVETFEDDTVDDRSKRRIVESFMKPWQGGGSYLGFFKSVSEAGGRASRPELEAIQWASPGHIDVMGHRDSFEKISTLLHHYDANKAKINREYDALWGFLSEMKLLRMRRGQFDKKSAVADEVNLRARSFSGSLGLTSYRTLKKMAGNDPLIAAKVLLASARRLMKMHQFFAQGKMALEDVDIG